ncbi:MAG: PEP-CTERM sorting domain-containing protein [Phycisphaerales bacterium]|nr:PEP-CTERM sorting domain-containing protein [Phycisphaerales bacterium]
MKKIALILGVAGMAAVANAQVTYSMVGENLTGAGGLTDAEVGDVIRVSLIATSPSSAGFAWSRNWISGDNVGSWDLTETTDGRGRNEVLQNDISDGPVGTSGDVNGFFGPVATSGDTERLEVVDGRNSPGRVGFAVDFVAQPTAFVPSQFRPQAFAGLNMNDGFMIYTFDATYAGGMMSFDAEFTRTRTYADMNAVQADDFTFEQDRDGFGNMLTVVPAPASMALLGLGGLVAARRRRA